MAKTKEEWQAVIDDIRASNTNIAADIERILGELQRTDLTEEEETDLFGQLQDTANALKSTSEKVPE